jgi:hypothetical protein
MRDGWEFDPPLCEFPADLPFAQPTASECGYLGMPREEPREGLPIVEMANIRRLLARSDWQARQTAARWLSRTKTDDSLRVLVNLAESDPSPVVRYTAGVSLVEIGGEASRREALRIAATTKLPRLKAEIERAFDRMKRGREWDGADARREKERNQ